jgi:DNA polymerase-3 subunit beta
MKFIVSSGLLLKNLQTISGVLNSNTPLPILENFLFDINDGELIISASDLETTMTTKLNVEARENGKIAIPASILLETLKTFPEMPLTFTINNDNFGIELSSDYGKYSLSGQDGEEFPRVPEIDDVKTLEMPTGVLSDAIVKTVFATGNDELRPVMTGVFFQIGLDNITFVATDAHKLVRYRRNDLKSAIETSFILPKKPLNLLKNALPSEDTKVNINYNNSNAFFSFNNITLICRLIDGRYPNYEAVIPQENPNRLTVDRQTFLSSIKRVSIFSNKSTHQVRLKITGSELQVSAEDLDFANAAQERMTCQYEGEDMEIGFNARFILDMLNNLRTNEVVLEMSTPNRAGLLLEAPNERNANEDILMLVMPVMLNS